MIELAAVRPDSWNALLFFHVLGAAILIGTLLLTLLVLTAREGGAGQIRLAYRTMLLGTLPAWFLMRVFAQLIANKEFPEGSEEPTWLNIGYAIGEPPLLLIVAAIVILARQRKKADSEGGYTPGKAATVIVALLLVAHLVALWAMTAKPG